MKAPPAVRFKSKYRIDPETTCWMWTASRNKKGYGIFGMHIGVAYRTSVCAHRASWIIHNGAVPEGLQVLHKCDVRGCVNPDHLFLGTNQDNVDDKMAKGREARQKGYRNPNSKLTDEAVREIRGINGKTLREIASQFGVTLQNVHYIRSGQTWKHVA